MRVNLTFALVLVFAATSVVAYGQTPALSPAGADPETVAPAQPPAAVTDALTGLSPANTILRDFHHSDVKFELSTLMDTLRDRGHEGWVLAAYPDPKTGKPLIGAGFSLDLPEREHPQTDPLNPHPFLEPSSADLWQAAGLEPARLDAILDQFNHRR